MPSASDNHLAGHSCAVSVAMKRAEKGVLTGLVVDNDGRISITLFQVSPDIFSAPRPVRVDRVVRIGARTDPIDGTTDRNAYLGIFEPIVEQENFYVFTLEDLTSSEPPPQATRIRAATTVSARDLRPDHHPF